MSSASPRAPPTPGLLGLLSLLLLPAAHGACSIPPDIPNAKPELSGLTSFPVKSTVTYKCNKGFVKIPGKSDSIVCLQSDKWSRLSEFCNRTCNVPPSLRFASLKKQFSKQNYFPVGFTVQYECRPGYKRDNSLPANLTCFQNLMWSSASEFCKRKSCLTPQELPHGHVIVTTDILFGSTITFTCDTGYRLVGPQDSQCILMDKNVTWSDPHPKCTEILCHDPPEIANGRIQEKQDSYKNGSFVTYVCNNDFSLIGEKYIHCTVKDEQGEWSGPLPECKETTTLAPTAEKSIITKAPATPAQAMEQASATNAPATPAQAMEQASATNAPATPAQPVEQVNETNAPATPAQPVEQVNATNAPATPAQPVEQVNAMNAPATPAQAMEQASATNAPATPAQAMEQASATNAPATPAQPVEQVNETNAPATPAQPVEQVNATNAPATPAQAMEQASATNSPATPAQAMEQASATNAPATPAQPVEQVNEMNAPATPAQPVEQVNATNAPAIPAQAMEQASATKAPATPAQPVEQASATNAPATPAQAMEQASATNTPATPAQAMEQVSATNAPATSAPPTEQASATNAPATSAPPTEQANATNTPSKQAPPPTQQASTTNAATTPTTPTTKKSTPTRSSTRIVTTLRSTTAASFHMTRPSSTKFQGKGTIPSGAVINTYGIGGGLIVMAVLIVLPVFIKLLFNSGKSGKYMYNLGTADYEAINDCLTNSKKEELRKTVLLHRLYLIPLGCS
uniref:Complement decay-accelerating factor isoform X2 n=1 Tax=Phascolarctos cinereus TaxID=38626 RepID=A0A6P5LMZ6_PHACI|nr:complement decay-accelerating factor isoform X2 [Phascolarctos cinereus]